MPSRTTQPRSTAVTPRKIIRGLAPHSLVVVGRRDPFIPTDRMNGLLAAVEAHARGCHVVKLAAGHVKTMMLSGRHQRCLSGVTARSPVWRLDLGRWRSALAQPAVPGSAALTGLRAGGGGNSPPATERVDAAAEASLC